MSSDTDLSRRAMLVKIGMLFNVAVGAVILAWPDIGLVTLAVFFAITMIVRGALAIFLGFKLRSLAHHPDQPTAQTASYA